MRSLRFIVAAIVRSPLFIKMFRPWATFVTVLCLCITLSAKMVAQTGSPNLQYTKNSPDLGLRSDLRVDPSTLGMSIQLPLGNYPGRAGTSMPVALYYNSKVWRIEFDGWVNGNLSNCFNPPPNEVGIECYTTTRAVYGENSIAGWTFSSSLPTIEVGDERYNSNGTACCSNDPNQGFYIARLTVRFADGSTHEMRRSDSALSGADPMTGTYYAVDSSRLKYIGVSPGTGTLYMPDGSRYDFAGWTATRYVDRNGNILTNQVDTLGRQIVTPTFHNGFAHMEVHSIPGVGGAPLSYTFDLRELGSPGLLEPDLVTGQVPSLHIDGDMDKFGNNVYAHSLFTSSPDSRVIKTGTFNPVVLHRITLPNGTAYTFTYNEYGEIAKVVYPTGGYERYRYGSITPLAPMSSPYTQANRGVVERRVSASGAAGDEVTWLYSSNGTQVTTDAPNGTRTVRLLHPAAAFGSTLFGFNDARTGRVREELVYNSAGALLRRTLFQLAMDGPQAGGHQSATRNARVVRTVEIILDTAGDALAATTEMTYDSDLNMTSTKRYAHVSISQTTAQTGDITTIAAGTLIRTEETDYLTSNPTYRNRHLISLPTATRVKDGAGNIVAQSSITYDEAAFPLLTYGSVAGWVDPGTGARGNATTTTRWLNFNGSSFLTFPSGTYLSTRVQYDQCGSVRKIWDARDTTLTNPTLIEYSSTYQFAYPTLSTSADPDGGGPLSTHVSSSEYDLSTGLVTAMIDVNGQRTTFAYNDPLNRLKQVVRAATDAQVKNQTSYAYDDVARTITITSDLNNFNDKVLKTIALFDGLGRTTETQQYEDSTNYIAVEQQYDSMGRVFKTSNPYRPWQSQTPVWTTTTFDALGRVLTVTTPDTAVVLTSYSGNTVTVTDQAGKKRKSVSDALGRLKEVYEDPGQLPTQLNYQTTYAYDVLDNLVSVTQGTQHRFFLYDSLERLIRVRNPEQDINASLNLSNPGNSQWCMAYWYDNNGNLTKKTDARGVTNNYVYDALNRNTTVDYSDTATINPDITRVYDTATNGKGRLRESYSGGTESAGTNVEHTKIVSYDSLGRPKDQRQRFKTSSVWSAEFKTLRAYNLAGGVTSQTYPSGHTINYSYDSAGRMSGFTGNLGDGVTRSYATTVTYSAFGGKQQEQFGTQTPLYHKLHYNVRGQLNDIRLSTVSWQTDQWNWNRGALINHYSQTEVACQTHQCRANSGPGNNGNIIRSQHWVPANDQISSYNWTEDRYTYDDLNRLTSVAEYHGSPSGLSAQDFTQIYGYDRWGNRRIDPATTNGMPETQFTVLANNRLGVPVGQTGRMDYDAAGNLINDTYTSYGRTDGTPTRLYDAENRLTTAKDANLQIVSSYSYNANGQRTRRKVGSVETWQVYGMDGELLAEYALNAATFVPTREYGYRNGELLVTVSSGDDQRLKRFVQNLYYGALQRDPTSQELTTRTNELATAGTQSQAQLLVKAKEIARALFVQTTYETNPMKSDTQYVTDLYYAYLQRGPDAGGLGWWVPQAAGSVQNRINVLNAFEAAGEFQTLVNTLYGTATSDDQRTQNLITNFYQGALGRPPNSTELATNSATLNSAAAQGQSQVISAAETMGRNLFAAQVNDASLSNTQYVTNLYEGFLQRGPDAGGLGWWSGQATVGQGRQNVLNAFAASIAFRELAGTLYREVCWLVADQLGTPRMVVNKSGTLAGVKRHDYLPFGEELFAGVGGRTPVMGYNANDNVRQKFTSKERDNETGLDYLIHRYYHPTSGRFTSPDLPFAEQWEVDPQSWNLYTYVGNQPLNFTDPFGLWKQVPCSGITSQCWEWEEGDDWSSLGVDAGLGNGAGKALAKYFSFSGTQLGSGLVVDLSGFMDWYNGLNPVQRMALREYDAGPPMGGGLRNIARSGPGLLSRLGRWLGLARSGQSASRNIGGITAEQAEKLRELLEKIPGAVKVRAFGSRTTGAFTKDSDLDIAILGNIDKSNPNTLRAVQEAQRYAESIGIGMGKGYRSLDINVYKSVQEMHKEFRSNPGFDPSRGLPKLVRIE